MNLAAAAQENPRTETLVDASPITREFYRLLDTTFGESNWRPNDDPRYLSELRFHPVDVIAPVDKHNELYGKAAEIETHMRRKFNARVLIFVIDETTAPV